MLEEGFKKKAEEMDGEIQQLKHNIEDMKKNSGSIFDTIIREVASFIFSPISMIEKGIRSLF